MTDSEDKDHEDDEVSMKMNLHRDLHSYGADIIKRL